jgi:Carboxypeptidase regulatory-like domain/TonB dependent receptor/TonB-dependent Receptor Plug Domain
MRMKVFPALVYLTLSATMAGAQVPTGTISGRVTDSSGAVLPGVTVTATSPNLQGPRVIATSPFGDYTLPLLPPGSYTVTFELLGFQTATQQVDVASTESVPLDMQLGVGGIETRVTVVGEARSFVATVQTGTNIRQSLMSTLPSSRTLTAALSVAPNVKPTGPGGTSGGDGSFTIAGAMAYDSVFLLNGVAITENIRGQPFNLFIEDAIQETTVLTSGISAEYGRFGGGLVNAITKSGGNEFSGSYRLGMNNDNWRAVTPFNETKLDTVVPTHEYTVGGPVAKDALWFFTAGRFRTAEESRQTFVTTVSYPRTDEERRYEGKLTYTVRPGQVVKGSFTKIQQAITNTNFQNVMDTRSLYNQEQPQDLLSLNYNGVMGTKLFLEGQYSQRHFSIVTSGNGSTDLINGTLLIDTSRGGTSFRYWSPTFCTCNVDKRDNSEVLAKATYFLSTNRRGAHTVVFGYNHYNDQRQADNHQSGSDYRILGTSAIVSGETIYPVFLNNNSTIIQWNPITLASQGSNIRTHALFANDSWRVNDGISVNLGLRWDRNQGTDAVGNLISNASALSHRLGIVWDPRGDGKWAISASTGRYVSGISSAIAETSPAGNPAEYTWFYQGPSINPDPNAAVVTPDVAIQQLFDWFNASGGTNRPFRSADVPGVNTFIGDSLKSPNALEYAAGVSRLLGERGSVRVDYVFRDFNDFYVSRTDLSTGQTTNSLGRSFDISLIENSNDLERRYQAAAFQANYRFGTNVEIGGNYTLSRTWGNFDGENPASGPLTAQLLAYPEYREEKWNQPAGNLGTDQRHRARIWGVYRVPMASTAGSLDVGIVYGAASGTPYTFGGATAGAPGTGVGRINSSPFVTNPGYATPVTSVEYYFFERDEYRTEAQFRTDLSVNYQYRLAGGVDLFFHSEVLNVFNQFQLCGCGGTVFNNGGGSDIRTINTAVLTAANSGTLQPFDPFTTTPVRGVNWNLGPTFGAAVNRFAYTSPRTFRFNFGVRF